MTDRLKPTQAKALERCQSADSSLVVDGAVRKLNRRMNEMIGAVVPVSQEVGENKRDQVMKMDDVTKSTALPGLGPRAVEAMRRVREAVCYVWLFHAVDLR